MSGTSLVTGVDLAMVPTRQFEAAIAFYGETLGLPRSVFRPDRGFAEFETGNLTSRRAHELEGRGLVFSGEILDTGVCQMTFFGDADGNALMMHHRYAPRVTEPGT